MTPRATSVLSVIFPPWLHGDSHLLEQKQAVGQTTMWRQLNLAQQFIETLLTANAVSPEEKEDESYLSGSKNIPKQVSYKLEHINYVLKRRSSQVQGSARFGLRLCLD